MTPFALREARQSLGLSAAAMAVALGLGTDSGRTIRRWESGKSPISGPVSLAVQAMLRLGLPPW